MAKTKVGTRTLVIVTVISLVFGIIGTLFSVFSTVTAPKYNMAVIQNNLDNFIELSTANQLRHEKDYKEFKAEIKADNKEFKEKVLGILKDHFERIVRLETENSNKKEVYEIIDQRLFDFLNNHSPVR